MLVRSLTVKTFDVYKFSCCFEKLSRSFHKIQARKMASLGRNENGIGVSVKSEDNGDKNGDEKVGQMQKTGQQTAPEGTRQNR